MYLENKKRCDLEKNYTNYDDFLESLKMVATISIFDDLNIERIVQLLNKTNQFNLTTQRYSIEDIRKIYKSSEHICIYGRLKDKFGDNGLVSVIIAKIVSKDTLVITDWVMSCRVFKRGLEFAMFNALVNLSKQQDIKFIIGKYIQTAKNKIVEKLYLDLGFVEIGENTYKLDLKTFKLINTKISY